MNFNNIGQLCAHCRRITTVARISPCDNRTVVHQCCEGLVVAVNRLNIAERYGDGRTVASFAFIPISAPGDQIPGGSDGAVGVIVCKHIHNVGQLLTHIGIGWTISGTGATPSMLPPEHG